MSTRAKTQTRRLVDTSCETRREKSDEAIGA